MTRDRRPPRLSGSGYFFVSWQRLNTRIQVSKFDFPFFPET